MKLKEESEKAGLKLSIQKTKIMASSPINSWQMDGETMETVIDYIFLGSKITADSDCSHEIQRCLLLGRKAMTNLESMLKSRDITLPTNVCQVKAMVFPVVMYGCESWTIKKAERWRTDAFELQCQRKLLRIPWTARRSNQSILKETNPEYSLEGLKLKLKLQYFGHMMQRADSLEKTLMLGHGFIHHCLQHPLDPKPAPCCFLGQYMCVLLREKLHLCFALWTWVSGSGLWGPSSTSGFHSWPAISPTV